jgi:hypothetical protein
LAIQATVARPSRTGGRHRKRNSRRWIADSKPLAVAISAVVLAGLVTSAGWLVKSAEEATTPAQGVAQAPVRMPAASPAPAASEPARPVPPGQAPAGIATDDKGFVDSRARCDATQKVVALGRTARSYVVVCGNRDGGYEYRGLRLSDDAMLQVDAEKASADAFLARNAGTVYAVSPSQLVVTAGDTVVKQEPMVEFRAVPLTG